MLANFIGRSLLLNPDNEPVSVRAGGYELTWDENSVSYTDPEGKVLYKATEKDGEIFIEQDPSVQDPSVVEPTDEKSRQLRLSDFPFLLAMDFQRLGLPGSDWPMTCDEDELEPPVEAIEAEPVDEESLGEFEDIEISEAELKDVKPRVMDPFRLLICRRFIKRADA